MEAGRKEVACYISYMVLFFNLCVTGLELLTLHAKIKMLLPTMSFRNRIKFVPVLALAPCIRASVFEALRFLELEVNVWTASKCGLILED